MPNALRAGPQRSQKTRIRQLFLEFEIAPAIPALHLFDQGYDFLLVKHGAKNAINLYHVKRYKYL